MKLMSINDTKAGMEGLDKAAINAIIDEASKGSKFYEAKSKAQKRIDAKKEAMTNKMRKLSFEQIKLANHNAEKLIEDLANTEVDHSRTIVHCDMDAFYASVEEKYMPELKDLPMAVGSLGMLSTSNYKARQYGVRSGMPGFIGKKLCPQLKIVSLNFSRYREESANIRQVFKEYDPNFCPMSLDEAYLDITDFLVQHPSRTPDEVVAEMRDKIRERTQLTASAGVSFNTMLAKICSDQNKPNGQFLLLKAEDVSNFIASLPVRKIGGIGNVTEQLLQAVGVQNCQDILEKKGLISLLFSELSVQSFFRIGLGLGCTSVSEMSNRERKSMSTETTFRDTHDPNKLRELCSELCSDLAADLQSENLKGRQVTIKIKTDKFDIKTKVMNLMRSTNDSAIIGNAANKILQKFMDGSIEPLKLRLLGVRMSELSEEDEQEQVVTIDKFLRDKSAVASLSLTTFVCPVCQSSISARHEAAFNSSHLDDCLQNNFHRVKATSAEEVAAPQTDTRSISSYIGPVPTASNSSCVSSTQSESIEEEVVCCPICGRKLSLNLVNPHLDECLTQQQREKKRKKSLTTSQSDKASALQQSKRPKFNSIDSYFIKQK